MAKDKLYSKTEVAQNPHRFESPELERCPAVAEVSPPTVCLVPGALELKTELVDLGSVVAGMTPPPTCLAEGPLELKNDLGIFIVDPFLHVRWINLLNV